MERRGILDYRGRVRREEERGNQEKERREGRREDKKDNRG